MPPFNAHFQALDHQRASEIASNSVQRLDPSVSRKSAGLPAWGAIDNTLPTVEYIVRMAETYYDNYVQDGTWNTHTKSIPGRALNSGNTICFNCGESHHFSKCPHPIDHARIDKNKKSFANKKKTATKKKSAGSPSNNGSRNNGNRSPTSANLSSGSAINGNDAPRTPSKWRRPEPHENNRRTIHTPARGSLEYKWNSRTNRWDPITSSSSGSSGANLSSSEGATTVTFDTPDFDEMSLGERRAYAANLTRVLEDVNNRI